MTTDQLAARLERLERSHARLKRFATLLGLLLAATFVGAMNEDEVPEVIRAKKFVALGERGASVTIGDGLFINGPQGSMAIAMKAFEDGANILMMSPDRQAAITFLAHAPGGEIALHDEEGAPLTSLDSKEGGSLRLRSKDRKERVSLSARSGASLVLSNDDGAPVCSMIADEDGNGVIAASDESGARAILRPGS